MPLLVFIASATITNVIIATIIAIANIIDCCQYAPSRSP